MIAYGKRVIMYLLERHCELIEAIYLAKEIDKKTFSLIAKSKCSILKVDFKKAQAMAKGGNHQGFLAKIRMPVVLTLKDIKQYNKIVVLCQITDVGNIGAIFRTVYCLKAEAIVIISNFLSESCYEGILRSSAGAMLDVPFCVYPNAADLINEFKNKNIDCYGADITGEDINNDLKISEKWALFLGNEETGLSKKILSKLDKILSIQINKNFNSLNVSVAAGILINRMD